MREKKIQKFIKNNIILINKNIHKNINIKTLKQIIKK